MLGDRIRPLRDRRDTVLIEMITAIHRAAPRYAKFVTPEEELEHVEGVRGLYDLFLDIVDNERSLTTTEAERIRFVGSRRAEQGFRFRDVRTSVRAAVRVARTYIVEEYEQADAPGPTGMSRVLDCLQGFEADVADLMEEGFTRRDRELHEIAASRLARLIDDLLDGRFVDLEQFRRRAAGVDWDTGDARGLLLAAATTVTDVVSRTRGDLQGLILHERALPSPHAVLLVPLPTAESWTVALRLLGEAASEVETTLLAVGECDGLLDLQSRYAGAVPLVPFLDGLADGRSVVNSRALSSYRVAAALDRSFRTSLQREVLSGLERCDEKRLSMLIDLLAAETELAFKAVAVRKRLGVHKETHYRRRAEFTTRTGYSIDNPLHQALLLVAYCSWRLDCATSETAVGASKREPGQLVG